MRKLRKGQLVEVTFYDHAADSDWLSDEKKEKTTPPICHVIGRVHHQDSIAIYTSHFEGEAGKVKESDLDTIVIGAIIEIWSLSYVGKSPLWRKRTNTNANAARTTGA